MVRPGLFDYKVYGEVNRLIYSLVCEYLDGLIDAGGAEMNITLNLVETGF